MKFWQNSARAWLNRLKAGEPIVFRNLQFQSTCLQRDVLLDFYLPPGYDESKRQDCRLLLINDGQDLPRMHMKDILQHLYDAQELAPTLIVGIHTSHARIREYGTARQADYKGRGDLAGAYTKFILQELVPYIQRHYQISDLPHHRAFAGFSLGGLSAFDIVWAYPDQFGLAGVFSGSFWWRWSAVRPEDPDADRIMHDIVHHSSNIDLQQRFWFQCGALDEEDDRNGNGIIDSIDDTQDLIKALRAKGYGDKSIRYLELENGRHEPQTWGEAMPDFLTWMMAIDV
ncbi:MAG: esterase family protein [Saprospiraceae bacterium]|nr:esterase family protein [Saprospiraceae bacterium]